jgi:uncharacterized protein YabN with tetrapyrrole methylase and pyrophosphatase domain
MKYLREESLEVAQAVRKGDLDNLCEELGDLLLQIVFHADIARENGKFEMADVVDAICRKLVRRHPHVFGKERKMKDSAEVLRRWDEIKAVEKAARARDVAQKAKSLRVKPYKEGRGA